MAIHIQGGGGCFVVILILVVPAILAATIFHSVWLLVGVPAGLIVLWAALGKWGPRRKVTPAQFADELEQHLLGTGGKWDWDDTTSIAIADENLDKLRCKLSKFDLLALPERRDELAGIIAALRRGEIPEVSQLAVNPVLTKCSDRWTALRGIRARRDRSRIVNHHEVALVQCTG